MRIYGRRHTRRSRTTVGKVETLLCLGSSSRRVRPRVGRAYPVSFFTRPHVCIITGAFQGRSGHPSSRKLRPKSQRGIGRYGEVLGPRAKWPWSSFPSVDHLQGRPGRRLRLYERPPLVAQLCAGYVPVSTNGCHCPLCSADSPRISGCRRSLPDAMAEVHSAGRGTMRQKVLGLEIVPRSRMSRNSHLLAGKKQ